MGAAGRGRERPRAAGSGSIEDGLALARERFLEQRPDPFGRLDMAVVAEARQERGVRIERLHLGEGDHRIGVARGEPDRRVGGGAKIGDRGPDGGVDARVCGEPVAARRLDDAGQSLRRAGFDQAGEAGDPEIARRRVRPAVEDPRRFGGEAPFICATSASVQPILTPKAKTWRTATPNQPVASAIATTPPIEWPSSTSSSSHPPSAWATSAAWTA